MREFRREILDKGKEHKPVDTYFTCTSEQIAPFMNSSLSQGGLTFGQNVTFLGRSGIRILKSGLRVAFVSGLDSDMLGPEVTQADSKAQFLGNHFVKNDIDKVLQEHEMMVLETGKPGVDILLTG